jgi:tetraacyldisaccharide 4'-kinase
MILLRKILFPFAAVYGAVTYLRNYFYDKGILASTAFELPIIAVGNLSVGGTGKSPQIEYLIRLLSANYKIATLSRGYKRKSDGFVLASAQTTAEILGDEPYQFYRKFPKTLVAVDADRRNGIKRLLELPEKPGVILLDDAFQHRKVQAGCYILLTSFDDLYTDDFVLPTGNLRESRRGAKRANLIIVTKCPPNLPETRQNLVRIKLRLKPHQQLFFSFVDYADSVFSGTDSRLVSDIRDIEKILVAGIAKPQPFFDHLKNKKDSILEFADHHNFSAAEIADIRRKANGRPIVTTEKDYVRLKDNFKEDELYYLPISSAFLSNGENFDKAILDYVRNHPARV